MLSSIWNFFKRHKRKFIFGGFFVGGAFYLYRYAQARFKEIQEKEAAECLAHAKRQHHFDSNQRTCNMTILQIIPSLRDILKKKFDTESIIEELKSNPSNKLDLWEKLKIYAFARVISTLYSCSIISLVLRVQLNILGGYMFLDTVGQKNGMSKDVTNTVSVSKSVQERYLALIRYFMDSGIHEMCNSILTSVEREIKGISLKEKLDIFSLEAISRNITARIESRPEISDLESPTFVLCQYMLPDDKKSELELDSSEDAQFKKLVMETRDVLESPDFHVVLKTSLERSFSKFLDCLADHYKQISDPDSNQNLHSVGVAMAKLVPVVSGMFFTLCGEQANPLIQELLLMEQTKSLAANVYEAFSQQQNESKGL